MNKEFSLLEIAAITEKLIEITNCKLSIGVSYKVKQFMKPFSEKYEEIIQEKDILIKKYLKEGETEITLKDDIEKINKELNEFFQTKDNVEIREFKLEWVEDLTISDPSILFQFFE